MPAGHGGAWPDNESTRRATHQRPGTTGVEGAGGTGGHGRASRSTTPSRRLAGGRALRHPEHQRSRKQQAQSQIPAAPPVWRAQEGPAAAPVGGRAWPRRPWAAGPGRGAGGRRQGLAGLRDDAPSHTPATQRRRRRGRRRDRRAWLQRPWVAGPGRGAGGWRQGQGGPRDRHFRAAGSRVAISRAGRRPPAHTAARPHKQRKNAARHSNCAA